MTFSQFLTEHAAEYLRNCLAQTRGNVQAAAQIAGVHRGTFYTLCDKCGVAITREPKLPRGHKSLTTWLGSKAPTGEVSE